MFNKIVLWALASLVLTGVLFGLVLPYLISAKSTAAVICGITLCLVFVYYMITTFANWVMKEEDENE